MPTWTDVTTVALALPKTELSTWYGTPGVKVAGKGFLRLRTEAEGGLEPGHGLLARRGAYADSLASAQDGRRQPGGLGHHQYQERPGRRLLQGLEKRIGREPIERVRGGDDRDLIAALVGRQSEFQLWALLGF